MSQNFNQANRYNRQQQQLDQEGDGLEQQQQQQQQLHHFQMHQQEDDDEEDIGGIQQIQGPHVQSHQLVMELGLENALTPSQINLIEDGGYSVSESNNDLGVGQVDPLYYDSRRNSQAPQARIQNQVLEIQNERFKHLIRSQNQELNNVRQENRGLKETIFQLKQNTRRQVQEAEARTQDAMLQLQRQHEKISSQIPLYNENITQMKDQLRQLQISQDTYARLKLVSDQKKSLLEFVQCRVYDHLKKHKIEINKLKLENQNLINQNSRVEREFHHVRTNLELNNGQWGDTQAEYQKRIESAQNRARRSQEERKKLQGDIKNMKDKIYRFDQISDRLRDADSTIKNLQKQNLVNSDIIQTVTKEKDSILRTTDNLRKQVELLSSDKNHMNRQNLLLLDKNKSLQEQVDKLQVEEKKLRTRADTLQDKIINSNQLVKVKYEQNFRKEIDDMKKRHQREMDLTRTHTVNTYEDKVSHYKDCKEQLEMRVMKLEHQLKNKETELDQVLTQFRTLSTKSNDQGSVLKLNLRMKSDELDRVRNLYEENMIQLKESKIQAQKLRQTQELVKSEYYKIESQSRTMNADIRAQLEVCKERLKNYEAIQKELDRAIMNVAEDQSKKHLLFNKRLIDDQVGNVLLHTIHSAPTTTKRRIEQSLLLANRLQTKQKQVDALRTEVTKLNDRISQITQQKQLQDTLLQRANQPYSMLLSDIQKGEKEQLQMRRRLTRAEKMITQLKSENQNIKNSKQGVEEDLKNLAAKRREVQELQSTLSKILLHRTSDKIDIKQMKSVLADSIRHNRLKQPLATIKAQNAARPNARSPGLKRPSSAYDKDQVPHWFKNLNSNLKNRKLM